MLGLMQDRPLLVSSLIEHAARHHPKSEIVSKICEGTIHRSNYAGLRSRAAKLAKALVKLGIRPGDRVATLAWNCLCYESLVEAEDDVLTWPAFDERTVSSQCCTSGTTGNPGGVDLTSACATDCRWRATASARTKVLPKKQKPCPN